LGSASIDRSCNKCYISTTEQTPNDSDIRYLEAMTKRGQSQERWGC
jgi:hypothetical protein